MKKRLDTIARFVVLWIVISLGNIIMAQVPLNTWRTHFSYRKALDVLEVNNKIYCITEGGLYYVNKADYTTKTITKLDGLGSLDITAIGYSENLNTLVIGYSDGTVDLVAENEVRSLKDITRKVTLIDKTINNITFDGNLVYLSCGFGIVVLDVSAQLFKDTYIIGTNNTELAVHQIVLDENNIFAATDKGVLKAEKNNPTLVNANNWNRLNHLPQPEISYQLLVKWNGKLLTSYQSSEDENFTILSFDEASATIENFHTTDNKYINLDVSKNNLIICNQRALSIYDKNNTLLRNIANKLNTHAALLDSEGLVWVADNSWGLHRVKQNGDINAYLINGPFDNSVAHITSANGRLYVAGTSHINWVPGGEGIYEFSDNRWNNYYNYGDSWNRDVYYFSSNKIIADPIYPDKLYVSAIRWGLVEMQNREPVKTYDHLNSALQRIDNPYSNTPPYDIRIAGMDYDIYNNLWVVSNLASDPLCFKTPEDKWVPINVKYNGFNRNTNVSDILIDKYNQKWVLIEDNGMGVLVFKETDDSYETFDEKFFGMVNQEGESANEAYCLEEDTEGNVWVGTDAGPFVFYNPQFVFDNDITNPEQIKIPRNDGTGLADFLLSTVTINDMDFDGANRMWAATNAGAFLISEDGSREIHHFTTENSPLISNNILQIEVNDKSGEVFIGTDKGILSYRGESTMGSHTFGDVYVFPNPVKPGFDGDIAITNLAINANVKITDVSGNLVYETTALGSQAVWDGRDFNGRKVNTGVYLVFCTNEDASETHVTKLLFIK